MKINLDGEVSAGLLALKNDLRQRLDNVGRQLGRTLAEKITDEVKGRLQGGGWIKLYRDSILYRETPEGTEWSVAGLSKQENLFKFPAATSLVAFTPTGDGRWPAEYNPWPIDMIPAANYRGTSVVVRSAPESTVEGYRAARANNLPALLAVLAEQNISVDPEGFPNVAGVYADIAYLARRLELGYPGFPRIPHWGPASGAAESSGPRWLTSPDVLRLVEEAINGQVPIEVPLMSKAEASELARLREVTWP